MTLSVTGGADGGGGRSGRFTDARDTRLAETAVRAIVSVVELPKPGLTDPRDPDTRHPGTRAAGVRDREPRTACAGSPDTGAAGSRDPAAWDRDGRAPGTGEPDAPTGDARHTGIRTRDGRSPGIRAHDGGSPGARAGDPRDAGTPRRPDAPARDTREAREAKETGEAKEAGENPGVRAPGPRAPGPRRPAAPDPGTLRWAARALAPGLTAMAAAARRTGEPTPELRAELGAIGRSTEWTVRRAACGTRAHHGAIWVLGLLVAASALEPGAAPGELGAVVKRLAAHRDRGAPLRPSPGSAVSVRYGAAGARGEARAGLPHVRRALDALRLARDTGADESCARLDALLTVMTTLQDTRVLYEAGPHGLRRVQSGARAVLDAGGTATRTGREALAAFDADLRAHALSPAGGVPLLAGALYAERAGIAAPGTEAPGGGSAARVRGGR